MKLKDFIKWFVDPFERVYIDYGVLGSPNFLGVAIDCPDDFKNNPVNNITVIQTEEYEFPILHIMIDDKQ